MVVSGTGIPAGAVISTIDSATQITMDQNATATTNDLSDLEFKYPANTNWIFSITLVSGAVALERPVVYTTQANLLTKVTKLDGVKVLDGNTDAIVVGTFTVSAVAGQVDNTIDSRGIRNVYQPLPLGFGWKHAWLPITSFYPADTNGAGALQYLDGVPVRAFDAATDESASIALRFPTGWAGSIIARPPWMVNNTDAGNVIWAFTTEAAAHGEVMAGAATTTLTASAAGGTQYKISEPALSAAHAAGTTGESILLTLTRDADNVAETYASDAFALGLDLYYLMYATGIEEV
jgi:hypothetical protein